MEMRPSGGGWPATAADPWRRIAPAQSWTELVLPDQQREALRAIASGRLKGEGANGGRAAAPLVLFAGPVGTGKTMAARIIGSQLKMPILEVDTTALRDKDRSRLDQALGRLFATAEAENAILFFEHADAVLSERPRPSAHQGRPGSLTARDLFERTERHPGLVIFASTLKGRIDPGYRDQFRSVVEFPFPDSTSRERIWHQLLPPDARLTEADLEELAGSFQLPGASIASCCSAAISAAAEQDVPVSLLHVAEAVQAEYRGRLASESTRTAVGALVARAKAARAEPAASGGEQAARNGAPPTPASDRAAALDRAAAAISERPARVAPSRAAGRRPSRRPSAGRAGYGLVAIGAIAAAFAIGFGASRLGSGKAHPAAGPSQAAAGPIEVSLPAGWHQTAATTPGLGLANQLTVAPRGSRHGSLTIGTLPPSDPALLPGPVLAGLHSVPTPQIATLGSVSFYRYPNIATLPGSGSETVYATPTTIGTLVGVCTTQTTSGCERVLSTVHLTSGSILGAASGVAYAGALNAVLTKLNATGARLGSQLTSARTAALQASLATQLAAAHASAAVAVSKLNPGLASAVNSQLAAALRSSAAAYGALAQAAQRHDPSGFASARSAVTSSQAAVSSALQKLSSLGYRVG